MIVIILYWLFSIFVLVSTFYSRKIFLNEIDYRDSGKAYSLWLLAVGSLNGIILTNDIFKSSSKETDKFKIQQEKYGTKSQFFYDGDNLLTDIKKISINKKPRSKFKPSDHTPIEVEIN